MAFTLNGNTRYILHEAIFDLVGYEIERHSLVPVLLFSPQEHETGAENENRGFFSNIYINKALYDTFQVQGTFLTETIHILRTLL